MDCLADHKTSVQSKHQSDGMELQSRALGNDTKGDVFMSPALRDPVCHQAYNAQSSRNRCALEVLRLAALVLRQNSHGDIETSQTSQSTQDEESQDEVIDV